MNKEKIKPLLTGLIKKIPGVKKIIQKGTGGTIDSRYCYSVWMRHLIQLNYFRVGIPENIAELGPGDSFGIGLAALLSGSKHFYALDVVKFWNIERNLQIFDELVLLFKNKTTIPGSDEYPKAKPELDNYSFPSHIISDATLDSTLCTSRVNAIRNELFDVSNPNNTYINSYVPWYNANVIKKNTIDFIYSQAVLEHVEDIYNTYFSMNLWLKPDSYMSHTIDFKSHGITKTWNGHWMFNNIEWNIVKGNKIFLINRQPYSKHIKMHEKHKFGILINIPYLMENSLNPKDISKSFSALSNNDLCTSAAYILSRKEVR